ncbi:RCC1 domain-containing protein, partial [Paenibacillus harenae]|uniref:RCC1 domain-containing protein n=1 Tax=Paenibacillus harenae TaxID=306543 RepID=UPI002794EF26|nr:alpha-tubulin suppressor-like RCC1 family protein [Paenibacillus harenae]
MRRRFMLLVCGFLLLTLLLPFQAAAAEVGSAVAAESSNSGVTMVVGGVTHTLALKQDGTVWAWGENILAQLGDGSTTNRSSPVQVTELDSVIAVAAGSAHSLALKSDGTVWAWGNNSNGQLGIGRTTLPSSSPVQVTNLSSVVAIASGSHHNFAIKSDGTVWAWGGNWNGQLGDGSTTERYTPVQVQGLSSVIDVTAGAYHSLAIKSDGTVWAWGNNDYGQDGVPGGLTLHDGTSLVTTYRHTPVQVQGLSSVIDVAAGYAHSLALNSDGTVLAWGFNGGGQLGDGSTTNRSSPVQVTELDSVS